ncbi:MAG: O-antigen ligase family protein [Kocuria sp.]|nr:O-antigen ligase family protein [Kocuria sp.]
MPEIVIVIAVVAATGLVMIAPLVPLWQIFTLLVLVRALGDWGLSTGQSPLPPGVLGAVVAIGMVTCLLVPWYKPLSRRALTWALLAGLWCAFFGLTAYVGAGLGVTALGEALRWFSLPAAALAATRVPPEHGKRFEYGILWAIAIPVVYQLVATMVQIPGTFQADTGRVMGTFSHPNPAGAFYALGALFCWYLVSRRRSALAVLVGLLSVWAALTTQNLSALVALFLAGILMRVAATGVSVFRKVLELGAIVVAGIAMLFVPQINARIGEFQNMNLDATGISADSANSLEWRLINWNRLLEIWAEKPWLGHGLSSTGERIIPLGSPPHSGPIQLLVETGIVGLATATGALIVLAMLAWKRRAIAGRESSAVLGTIVVIFCVGSMDNILNYAAALYLSAFVIGHGLTATHDDEPPRRAWGIDSSLKGAHSTAAVSSRTYTG